MNIFAMSQPLNAGDQARGKTLSIPAKHVIIAAYSLLITPILIFFIGWLKWYLAILFSAILLFGAFWIIKTDYWDITDKIEISILHFILIAGVFGLWIAISGSSWLGDQTFNVDVPFRNAVLRDLIDFDWPIYFPETKLNMSGYYFIFWMIPALFGKLFGLKVAFAVQILYLLLIFVTSFLIIVYILKDTKKSTIWAICIFMIFFSGLIVIRNDIESVLNLPGAPAYYRSHQNLLGNAYHQTPMCLVATLLLENKKIHNFAFWGLILLPFSPWAAMGIAILMIAYAIKDFLMRKSISYAAKEIFSIANICAVCSSFFVFALFLSGNSNIVNEGKSNLFAFFTPPKFDFKFIIEAVVFWLSEFGIYYIFIWKKYKKDSIFRIMLPLLMIYAYIWFNGGTGWNDFASGASSPLLYILMIYIIGYVKDDVMYKPVNLKRIIFFVCIVISFLNPYYDMRNKIGGMIDNKSFVVQNDNYYTFSNKKITDFAAVNITVENAEKTPFFRYLAKHYDKPESISENLSKIKEITDIDEYLDYLAGKDCTIYVVVQDIQGYSLRQKSVNKMKEIGFDENLDLLMQHEYHSFIGIVNNGEIVTEQIGRDEYISYSTKFDGYPVNVESATLNAGNFSTINIRGREYSPKGRGLNIVVRDNLTGCVIDSVAFDTHVDEIPCVRME